jgi:hypothetical protein
MEVQRPRYEPPLRCRSRYTAPLLAWQATALAAGLASLFILLLRSLGA